ncbi:Forkhead box protein P2 [Cichlidogyrus casuarinus]|uniref:Forkhead box protein P2 n=1 Tax=Cichlidogyrus casuarinus TaxID=1844966 RepID=A0ABD2PSB9_9PLAT
MDEKGMEKTRHFYIEDLNSMKMTIPTFWKSITNLLQDAIKLSYGFYSVNVLLSPTLTLPNFDFVANKFHLKIFGFLNKSDLSNAPIYSRHCLCSAPNNEDALTSQNFLLTLLESLRQNKCVALAMYETEETGRRFYAILHPIDFERHVLMLSFMQENVQSLPWLGDFNYLAPVIDFSGHEVYNDETGKSPFPVRTNDCLSYKLLSLKAGEDTSTFNYFSWISTTPMRQDINKIVRLSKKLPDKFANFQKELKRVRSGLLAYGCQDLMSNLLEIIKTQISAAKTNQDALREQMSAIEALLTPPVSDSNPD